MVSILFIVSPKVTRAQASAVDLCNVKVNKHFTTDMPAILRQLQVIETQRCETLAQCSLQYATMQLKLYQNALETNWKDLVLVNTFNPLQDINAFVAFTSTGARCPPPPILGPDTILSPPVPAAAPQPAAAAQSDASRAATPQTSLPSSTANSVPVTERPVPRVPPPLPPKTSVVDGKVGQSFFHLHCSVLSPSLSADHPRSHQLPRAQVGAARRSICQRQTHGRRHEPPGRGVNGGCQCCLRSRSRST